MSNEVQGNATFHLLYRTEMGMEEFLTKFHQDNIIDMKVQFTLSDGSLHTVQACDILDGTVTNFEVNGEEMIREEVENKEKITKINSVIKIAI